MTRPYRKTCKSCNKYQKPDCPRFENPESTGYGTDKICEHYYRAGGRNIKKPVIVSISTAIKCKEESCKYYDARLKSGCVRGDDPENCRHYEFLSIELRNSDKREDKNLSGVVNMKLENETHPHCQEVDCLYFAKSARSRDNCNLGAYNTKACNYTKRHNTKMKTATGGVISPDNAEKIITTPTTNVKNIIQGLSKSVPAGIKNVLCGENSHITIDIICKIAKEYDVEIIIRPAGKI